MKISLIIVCFILVFGCSTVRLFSLKGVKPVNNHLYEESCGDCHFAYPPGLLPKSSWEKLLKGTKNHFGENLELNQIDSKELTRYLFDNAADKSIYKRSRKIMLSLGKSEVPLRITKVPYIRDKHKKISKKYIGDNPEVETLGNCNACHTGADQGSFDDDSVFIPNYGRWND